MQEDAMLPNGIVALSLAALLAAPVPPEPIARYVLEPDQVLVSYQATLGKHQISGVSTRLEWRVTAFPDGSAQVWLQVPIESFKSGHPQLDEELRRAMGAGEHATIEVEGIAKAGAPIRFEGTVTMNGVQRPFHTVLMLSRAGAQLAVRTAFAIELDSFAVVRPAQIGGTVEVDFAARLRIHPQAAIAGGMVNSKRPVSWK
jgi:polyisoprenoid-binding protein YceI